jgi:hypothetical protein
MTADAARGFNNRHGYFALDSYERPWVIPKIRTVDDAFLSTVAGKSQLKPSHITT